MPWLEEHRMHAPAGAAAEERQRTLMPLGTLCCANLAGAPWRCCGERLPHAGCRQPCQS